MQDFSSNLVLVGLLQRRDSSGECEEDPHLHAGERVCDMPAYIAPKQKYLFIKIQTKNLQLQTA